MKRLLALLYVILAPLGSLHAAWTGFPVSATTNATFESLFGQYDQLSQIVSAVNERCTIVGIDQLSIVETWEVLLRYDTNVQDAVAGYRFGSTAANTTFSKLDSTTYTNYDGIALVNDYGTYIIRSGTHASHELYFNTQGFVSTNWVTSFGGTSPTGYTALAGQLTNVVAVTTNVTTTNAIGLFEWSAGAYSGTSRTVVTYAFIDALWDQIEALIPYFVSTNQADAQGTLNTWFALTGTNGLNPSDFPMESKAGLFSRQGIGIVSTNLTYSAYNTNFITGGDAWLTRWPTNDMAWPLAELQYTGRWSQVDIGTLDKRFHATNAFPVLRYIPAGTNAVPSCSVTVTGLIFDINSYAGTQATIATTETASVTASNTLLTQPWHDIQFITNTAAGTATGDVLAVVWTNARVLYGDRPYRLTARHLDELYSALNPLVWTRLASAGWTNKLYEGSVVVEEQAGGDTYTGTATYVGTSEADLTHLLETWTGTGRFTNHMLTADIGQDWGKQTIDWLLSGSIQTSTFAPRLLTYGYKDRYRRANVLWLDFLITGTSNAYWDSDCRQSITRDIEWDNRMQYQEPQVGVYTTSLTNRPYAHEAQVYLAWTGDDAQAETNTYDKLLSMTNTEWTAFGPGGWALIPDPTYGTHTGTVDNTLETNYPTYYVTYTTRTVTAGSPIHIEGIPYPDLPAWDESQLTEVFDLQYNDTNTYATEVSPWPYPDEPNGSGTGTAQSATWVYGHWLNDSKPFDRTGANKVLIKWNIPNALQYP